MQQQMAVGNEEFMREGQIHMLELKKENVKELLQVVKAITFRDNGTLHALDRGLRIIVDDSHCQQAIAYFEQDSFQSFVLREESCIRIPLADITDCLSMIGDASSTMRMTYDGIGEPLRLQATGEDAEFVVQANIHTLTNEAVLEFEFDGNDVTMELVIKPDVLRQIVKEFDSTSSTVSINVSNKKVAFITKGDLGAITTTIPSHSEAIERLHCAVPVSHRIRYLFIKRMLSALSIATKVCLRFDSRGVLNVHFVVNRVDDRETFIEFFCLPDDDDLD